MHKIRNAALPITLAMLAIPLFAAGCGGSDDTKSTKTVTVERDSGDGDSDSSKTDTTDTSSEDSSKDDSKDGSSSSSSESIASVEMRVSDDGTPVRIDLTSLRRTDGDTVTLEFEVTNLDDSQSLRSSSLLGSGGGVSLVDAAGQKRYLVLIDEDENCVCTLPDKFPPSEPVTGSAKLPAPPKDTDKVSVEVGDFPVIDDVAIED